MCAGEGPLPPGIKKIGPQAHGGAGDIWGHSGQPRPQLCEALSPPLLAHGPPHIPLLSCGVALGSCHRQALESPVPSEAREETRKAGGEPWAGTEWAF